jgi:hypothetical protein
MKHLFRILAVLILVTVSAHANTDVRNWTLVSGDTFQAELVQYDPVEDAAVLRTGEDETRTYSVDDFSPIDAAWLLEWAEFSQELDVLMKNMAGEFRHFQHQGAHPADCYVYTPSQYRQTTQLPMLFLFHPSGKGARYVQRFMLSAEALGVIVVSSDAFRNTGGVWNEKDDDMLACFKELLPVLDSTVPHDANQFYMGGSSGGAQRALHFAAKIDRPWAGIFSNGGWIGGTEYYDLPFPEMRVVMVNGNRDHANSWIERDKTALAEHGCDVCVFAFEGGHQVPPPTIQLKALSWLITGEFGVASADPSE